MFLLLLEVPCGGALGAKRVGFLVYPDIDFDLVPIPLNLVLSAAATA